MKKISLLRLFLLSLVVFSSACATQGGKPRRHSQGPIVQDHFAEVETPEIPLVMNDRVQGWIDYFEGKGRPHYERYLKRSGKYTPMIRRILRQQGLPDNLVYLAMIESGFNPHAYSCANASGTWQFIYQTGVRYGLKVDEWVDERRDPEKSTVAAAKYLKDLFDRYNDWYLAAAGYNAGEGKIDRAIRKYATEDFWELTKGRYLREETKDYVPKIIAAAMIAKNPEKYGFKDIVYEEPVDFDEVTLEGPLDLRVAAKLANTTYDELKALNPELLHWIVPPKETYRLKLPAGSGDKFEKEFAELSPEDRMGEEKLELEASESVVKLAKKKGVPVILLAAANDVSVSDSFKKGDRVVIPLDAPPGEEFFQRSERGGRGGRIIVYRVKTGEKLAEISRKTGLSVAAIKKNNPGVNWNQLKKGQPLKLYASSRGGKRKHSRSGHVGSKKSKRASRGKKVRVTKKGLQRSTSNRVAKNKG